MKTYLLIILSLVFRQAAAQKVLISGKFNSTQKEVKIEDISALQYLQPQNEKHQVMAEADGNFNMSINLVEPGYFRLGRNILYLSPGDNLTVNINHLYPEKSSFEGKGSTANLYLRNTPFPKGGSYLEAGKLIKNSPGAMLDAILARGTIRNEQLKGLTGISAEFRRLEMARTNADIVNSILSVKSYFARKLKLKGDSAIAYLDTFMKEAEPELLRSKSTLADQSLLQLVVFRDISKYIVNTSKAVDNTEKSSLLKISDWISADSIVQRMVNINDKKLLSGYRTAISKLHIPEYKQALEHMLTGLLHYGNGDNAIDFTAIDLNGKNVKLSDYKGKTIYIDLWATWCGPCLAEMPAFEQLKTHYADHKNIIFISLSIDEDIEKWKMNVKQRNATGIQWHITRSMLKDYQLINIPRTIVIANNFKIADFKSLPPSSAHSIMKIDQLLENRETNFSIKGKLLKVPVNAVMFLSYQLDEKLQRDSIKIKDGIFEFSGRVSEIQKANLLLANNGIYAVKKSADLTSVYLGGGTITINGKDSISTSEITGNEENDANQQLKNVLRPIEKQRTALLASLNTENRKNKAFIATVKERNLSLIAQGQAIEKEFILQHPQLMASLDVLKSYLGPIANFQEAQPLFNSLSTKVKVSLAGKEFEKGLNSMSRTEIGQLAPDFSMPDTSGKSIVLSSFRGKYVLLDFWASWCAPCRAENPNILEQYQKFKDRNFTILGVSLDGANAKMAWLKAIKDDGLIWTNIADLKAWNNEAAQLYSIKAIPQNFLIGPDGKILAKNLRGEALNEMLSNFLE